VTVREESVMGSAKDEVRRILEQIPDSASFEDIQYHIYVREKIERGLEDVKEGRVIRQEEVERRMRKWTGE
jgi:predicted transcriptional regulator